MIEVHRVGREDATAVHAGNAPEVAQPGDFGSLAPGNALDLLLAIPRVVGGVVGTLVAFGGDMAV